MKAYLVACTLIFAFVAVIHSLELAKGGAWHLHEADFLLSSLVVIGMFGWSVLLLMRQWRRWKRVARAWGCAEARGARTRSGDAGVGEG